MNTPRLLQWIVLSCALLVSPHSPAGEPFKLNTRRVVEDEKGSGMWRTVEKGVAWDPAKTAVIICDMWDKHWCQGATARVAEMAPRMNEVVKAARARGAFIIHAPSDTMEFYKDFPQRKRAQDAPPAKPPIELKGWRSLDPSREGPLPIDDSDGGCDDLPQCKQGRAWSRQIAAIEIAEDDAVTDSAEAYNLLEERGIENVIVMGVHANMCVLGRPFSIRQMVGAGKNVLLMRDMTDTMYNSRMKPFVSHFRGTDLVVEHIEKYWCPSITSADFLGGVPFRFSGGQRTKVLFMIGDDEYKTEITLPAFAKSDLEKLGFESVFAHSSASDKDDFPGLDALKSADLLVVSARRRALSEEQMKLLRDYITSGRPVIGLRTASHAFDPRPARPDRAAWPAFDDEVLGGDYQGHYGKGPAAIVEVNNAAANHPILRGIPREKLKFATSLYKYPSVGAGVTVLLRGTLENDGSKNEPVAWVNSARQGKVFYTSLGGVEDFENPAFRKLLANAFLWCAGRPVPSGSSPETSTQRDGPLSPRESLAGFKVSDDLQIELMLSEPVVRQPLQLSWDERGRMWVVQYIQYPAPAGVTLLSKDQFWRAVYDKVPPPPPHHFHGEDKVTIHEDTDGDGQFDKHKTFVDGLNIVTAVAHGRGGVWILNPPYLLFYPDANHDDVPDGDPVVHLAGFGLEDTHSVANSLRWGPDGWLYGAHGSTVTAAIVRPGLDTEPIAHMMGQGIWRYHPESRQFEVFAEGGGNAFGVEMDDQARIFSGHNGGNTRGFHYVQGGYLQKGFEKHGPLSNPFAFGYFRQMANNDAERFTHTFVIYGGGAFSEAYTGKLFGVEPLQGRVVLSDVLRDRSSFKTWDLGFVVTNSDRYFKPVDIKAGPDGAIYVADWYDRQVTHTKNYEGQIDKSDGRIYRITQKGQMLHNPVDFTQASNDRLIELLQHSNRAIRQTALRVIADRRDSSLVPRLRELCQESDGQFALECLWALNLGGGLDDATALRLLEHGEPQVRAWTVRLKGDQAPLSPPVAQRFVALAATEAHVEVRSQLASTAKRMQGTEALRLIVALLGRSEDKSDIHVPLLLWWALESKAESDRPAVLGIFENPAVWSLPIVEHEIAERLMRRYAQAGTRANLLACARLLELAPNAASQARLLAGFNEAFKGRSMSGFPEELRTALSRSGGETGAMRLRRGDRQALDQALAVIGDRGAANDARVEYIQILGEVREDRALPVLLNVVGNDPDHAVRKAALLSLQIYDDPAVAGKILSAVTSSSPDFQSAAFNVLASRAVWADALLASVADGKVQPGSVPPDAIEKLRALEGLTSRVQELWPEKSTLASAEDAQKIESFKRLVLSGSGDPFNGQELYRLACASCHKLFGEGGQIGPDLTAFNRQDLESMLLNVISPSAQVREGYENVVIETRDGRTLSGIVADKDNQVIVIRGADGESVVVPQAGVARLQAARTSLMPEGLIEGLEDQQVRDLFAYLRSTQPLVKR